jgi:hypothetical protein
MKQLSNKEFFAQLEKHPQLLDRMKNLLRIVEGEGEDDIQNANAAEYAVTDQLRPLGKELLDDWGKKQVSKANKNVKSNLPDAKIHSKKN